MCWLDSGVHRIDVFGVSASRTLLHWVYQNNTLSAREDLGGYLISAPAAVVWTSTLNGTVNVIDVFARNANNSISDREFYKGVWSPWSSLGGVNFSSGPSVASDGPNDIEMVAKGSDNQIYMLLFRNSIWESWFSIGGVNFSSAPTIASFGFNYWEVFARGSDNALYIECTLGRIQGVPGLLRVIGPIWGQAAWKTMQWLAGKHGVDVDSSQLQTQVGIA